MANKRDVLTALVFMDESSMISVIDSAFVKYSHFISDVYNDIYKSCIKLYYSTYYPDVYDRHGNKTGWNLYNASDIFAIEDFVVTTIDEYRLEPYRGETDKRDYVLEGVLDGIRGVGSSKNPDWPQSWDAYYPNRYSHKHEWSSSASTLDGIFVDFAENGVDDTLDVFYDYLGSYI